MTVKAHWMNWWLLRPMTRPYVLIDGVEYKADWRTPVHIDVDSGTHEISAGIRYRGFTSLLGVRAVSVHVDAGQTVRLLARNGLFNHEPFYVTAAPAT
ncbi:hypothetical protein GCM10027344_07870 [Spelaeicoccus albus]